MISENESFRAILKPGSFFRMRAEQANWPADRLCWAEELCARVKESGRVGGPSRRNADEGSPGSADEAVAVEAGPESLPRWIDPLELSLAAALGPAVPIEGATLHGRSLGLDPLLSELVRAIAWGGDRRRGTVRLELGGSRYAGTSVLIRAEGRELSIEVEAPLGVDAAELAARLRERLGGRGLRVCRLSVR